MAHGVADSVAFTTNYHNLQCLVKQFDLTEHARGTKVYNRRQEKRMHEHQEGIGMNHDTRFADSLKKLLYNIQGYMPSSYSLGLTSSYKNSRHAGKVYTSGCGMDQSNKQWQASNVCYMLHTSKLTF